MPSRKFHSKNRHGCDVCKKSKVKCDLARPICARCTRLSRPCSFAREDETATTDFTSTAKAAARRPAASTPEASPFISQAPHQELRLMHHFSTSTCFTMTDVPEIYPLWQIAIPKIAFSEDFLLHGLLAISALQLQHEKVSTPQPTSPSWLDLARTYQQSALSSYIPKLKTIDDQNCHALFALSAILGGLSYAFLKFPEKDEDSSAAFVQNVIDIFDLLVGSSAIAVEGQQWLKKGPLEPLFTDPFKEREPPDPTSDVARSLDALLQADSRPHSPISTSYTSSDAASNQVVYLSSIHFLLRLFPSSTPNTTSPFGSGNPSAAAVISWPVFLGPKFLSLLKAWDPKALVILAHYAAALHIREDIWYLKGLGYRLARAIYDVLSIEWRPFVALALAKTAS